MSSCEEAEPDEWLLRPEVGRWTDRRLGNDENILPLDCDRDGATENLLKTTELLQYKNKKREIARVMLRLMRGVRPQVEAQGVCVCQ